MSYRYVAHGTPQDPSATFMAHAGHNVEEWHAYVCDLTDAPESVTGSDTGICCHDCQVIVLDRPGAVAL